MPMLELIAHAQLPLINAHANVAKARISIFPKQNGPRSDTAKYAIFIRFQQMVYRISKNIFIKSKI